MRDRLHVGFFSNTYHPVVSGVVRSISTFRQALAGLGHLVFIFAQEADDYEDSEPFVFRYPAVDLPTTSDFPLIVPVSPCMEKLMPSLKLDVVHSHHPFLLGQRAAKQAAEMNLPLVFTFHTRYRDLSHYIAFNQELIKGTIDHIICEYMRRCQHIIAPSESMRQLLVEEYGVSDRVTVVPTGIDLEIFRQANGPALRRARNWGNDKVLISIGRLVKEKNWQTLLAAAMQVMKKQGDVRLVIIGEGDERQELEEQVRKANLVGRVEFIGKLPFAEVAAYLKAADLFCFASVIETQGLVTVEAMAAGLPTVAVDALGIHDMVTDGQEGLLTANDSQALAGAIERLLTDDALYRRLKAATEKKAREFEISRQAGKLVTVYEQAIEDRKAKQFVPVEKYKPVLQLFKDQLNKLPMFDKQFMER